METKTHTKLLHESDFLGEVEVDLIDAEEGWGPYLSLEDVQRLDEVRLALRRGDIEAALKMAKVYRLTPVTAA
jgi:hypothetical protein